MSNEYEERLKSILKEQEIAAEHLSFTQSCHSVAEAAAAANARIEDCVKNICMFVGEQFVVAIVKGEDRASTSRVARALKAEEVRTATPEEILARTGFPCGGTPSFGFAAKFLVDPRVLERESVYTGGGSENSLMKITPRELLRVNKGEIVRVRK
jgi:prolyl-tRNA editing enzyme YbaK/EbsC (Cys-tRNA(Pro) deacylase)